MKYEYTQNPTAKKPIILIDKYIGTNEQGVTGIDEGQFTREVLSLKNAGVTEAEVWINSKGGAWSTSVGIVSAMNNSGIDFTTKNMGFADSSAGHIFQAGKTRVWMPQSLGLIHEIQGDGDSSVKEAMNGSVATMLCGKTNQTAEQVRGLMKGNTMMDAKMAKDYGFCDEVGKTGSQNILKFTNRSEAYEAGQKQIKNLLPKNKNMEAVNKVLGLTNEASETAQLEAIGKIIEAKNAAETTLTAKVLELTNATEALTIANGKLLLAENSILTATNDSKKVKAEALVKEHAGKRIVDTPESIAKWTNAAIDNYDATKTLIEGINYNATAPVPPTVNAQRSKDAPPTSVSEWMAKK